MTSADWKKNGIYYLSGVEIWKLNGCFIFINILKFIAEFMNSTFYLFCYKSFIVFIWSMTWEMALWWLKGWLVAAGRGTGRSSDIRWMWRCPSKAAGLWKLLVVLEGEPFEEILDWPSPARGQPPASLWRLVRWSPKFLMSFASSSGSGSPGSPTDGDLCG